jgi:hypothetical protein
MTRRSTTKTNVYLDKINENLLSLFRTTDKFDQTLNDLSAIVNGATVHINDMERIVRSNDDDDDNEDEQTFIDDERDLLVGDKLCQLNDNLNVSMHELRQCWLVRRTSRTSSLDDEHAIYPCLGNRWTSMAQPSQNRSINCRN